ncbi:MAG: hypothetical protein IMW89_17710 [Ktedonobacteraceae bacterium]|nr:hypothetical protein [Ktedonobacteraceae bacterium]
MVNLLPAVLVGGPPHAGKSVLFYRLTQVLRERGIDHHAIRACPDGEGNWFHEGDPDTISNIRVKLQGEWPASFVQRISQDLEHRRLPFLVDMGGAPRGSQKSLFRLCTHSILLLREDKPEARQQWQRLVEEYNLLPLARLFSRREGDSLITARSPFLEGTISGLERHMPHAGAGPVFDELVEQLAALFGSYDLAAIKQVQLEQAPTELVLDLKDALRALSSSTRWEPAMLADLLASLPAQTPLSVYGTGPGWLYAALAAWADPQPFYLFDPKLPLGWIQPARVSLSSEPSPDPDIHTEVLSDESTSVLKITFPRDRIEYFRPDPLVFPNVPVEKGLIISGRVPHWLLTALVGLYKNAGVAWIAPFYAQMNRAVVAYSYVETCRIGDLLSCPVI